MDKDWHVAITINKLRESRGIPLDCVIPSVQTQLATPFNPLQC